MSGTVFHLLTETDSFSDTHGAALQRWVANVLRHDGERAVVVCARADESWGLDHVAALRLPALRAYSQVKGRYRLPWRLRKQLLRTVFRPATRLLQPGDTVWIHNRPDYAGAIEEDVRDAGAHMVVHLHNSLLISFPREVTSSFCADRLVFCSGYLEREARIAFPGLAGTRVIHNGADERRFFPLIHPAAWQVDRHEAPTILFAGRLVPEKGAHIFVEAMRLLQQRGTPAIGRLLGATGFGSANHRTDYARKIRRQAPTNVEFGGYYSANSLGDQFRRASIFCSPSVWEEPFGLVNVEAMASAVPVVSTLGGGVPEIFAEGGGLLVARNSATELASALERILHDGKLRRQLATEAYESFHRNFTWQAAHHRYRAVLSGLT